MFLKRLEILSLDLSSIELPHIPSSPSLRIFTCWNELPLKSTESSLEELEVMDMESVWPTNDGLEWPLPNSPLRNLSLPSTCCFKSMPLRENPVFIRSSCLFPRKVRGIISFFHLLVLLFY
jgi:hypothetical protein